MLQIHPNARTTPAVRAKIARSTERNGVLAAHYGISTETVRKWRGRGPKDCTDPSSRPRRLRWRATADERRIVCLGAAKSGGGLLMQQRALAGRAGAGLAGTNA